MKTVYSTADAVEQYCVEADLVIGTVLIPGANAPKLVTKDIMKKMKAGAVIVDVAIDQGGCTDVSKPTTHENPTFATLPFALAIADKGIKQALLDDKHLLNGLNTCQGKMTYKAVAEAQGLDYTPAIDAVTIL